MFLRSHKRAEKENAPSPSPGVEHCVLNPEGAGKRTADLAANPFPNIKSHSDSHWMNLNLES